MSDSDLGAFLRARREAVTPADAGLPAGGARRRTPGLRRAELATLSGVSVEYLTRLEQGRDSHPSAQVLGALSDALRLSVDERVHLRRLAKTAGGASCGAAAPARTVRPTVRALLDRLGPGPAVLLNRLSDVLAFTDGFERLADPPNLARFVFTDARARTGYPDWDRVAEEQVSRLRLFGRDEPHVAALADELTVVAGAAFVQRWQAPPSTPRRTGVERWVHPDAGELRLAYEVLDLPDADGQRLIVYLPDDDGAAAGLDHLTGRRPGTLRAVAG
ncbi:transcriptional regulator with XRE-family HTH domain [Spinactinospora alkalitolerans]|uniref:Transcriptional regulator with XRE-family HTH domain n=1 Tax=Spinactinospora alkalitolerans TaxID=687207 RepID=A0A852TVX2_9ACTN|nr:helix-turn-helix transcriptional regulator [Spinactinospora alkalitolerans]NYE47545.1 transcriptional regulator with XRE-family HTH domain [Spinactinospora alkalitolerans]